MSPLNNLTAHNSTLSDARWLVFGLFTTIECLPVIVAVHAIQAGIAVTRVPGRQAPRAGRAAANGPDLAGVYPSMSLRSCGKTFETFPRR